MFLGSVLPLGVCYITFCVFFFLFLPPAPSLPYARYKQCCESAGRVAGRAAADILTVGRDLLGGEGTTRMQSHMAAARPHSSSARAELIISLTRSWTVT